MVPTEQSAFQEPIPIDGRGKTAEATEMFAPASLSALRYSRELVGTVVNG